MQEHLKEVEKRLRSLLKTPSKMHGVEYIGGGQSKLDYIGLRVPQLDEAYKKGFSFNKLSHEEQVKVWKYIWENSNTYEVMSLSLWFFGDIRKKESLLPYWNHLKKKVKRIDNWAHSDTLCSLYAFLLEEDPKLIFPTLKEWNKSKNLWERRCSIVGTFYYSSLRKKPRSFKEVIPLVENLLYDKEYYVQKGVGWTLRELYNLYPKETYNFLLKYAKVLSAQAWQAATEKLSIKDKARLKAIRQKK